jgi:hypothetical protein
LDPQKLFLIAGNPLTAGSPILPGHPWKRFLDFVLVKKGQAFLTISSRIFTSGQVITLFFLAAG